jgi:DNA repair protein RecN (Recombination protein N)
VLGELRVENLAVIERAEARFGNHFNAVTGETGAGKSVLLAGLGLCLGERADPDLVRRGADRASASAAFTEPSERVGTACRELGVTCGDTLVLTRELLASGRSSARANGGLVPASGLRDLSVLLVDVQGQGASSLWLREAEQRAALDDLGGGPAAASVGRVGELWALRQANRSAAEHQGALRSRQRGELEQARLDLFELEAANLRLGEEVELGRERQRLAHATRLREASLAVREAVAGGEGQAGAADRMAGALHGARAVVGIDPELDRLLEQADASLESLRELQLSLSSYLTRLPDDSAQLAEVEERLDLLGRLARRHGGSVEAAVVRRDEAAALLRLADQGDGELERLGRERAELEREMAAESGRLSAIRAKVGARLARAVTADLRRMLMPKAEFQVRIWQVEDDSGIPGPDGRRLAVGPEGRDRVAFDLAANPGDPPRPLAEVASGGELARVALALLSHLTRESGVSTVVFDEIDQGLGGEAANRVGELMREVATRHQVICITHLAPIAARADTHLVVVKSERDGRPHSEVVEVRGRERVEELARLLAGEATPGAARAHAEELLQAVGVPAREA